MLHFHTTRKYGQTTYSLFACGQRFQVEKDCDDKWIVACDWTNESLIEALRVNIGCQFRTATEAREALLEKVFDVLDDYVMYMKKEIAKERKNQ